MSRWPATRAARVYATLLRIGWELKRQAGGSHRVLSREGFPDFVWAFHDRDEIGPRMLARIARRTGLRPEDLELARGRHGIASRGTSRRSGRSECGDGAERSG